MSDYVVDLPSLRWQAVQLPQTRIVPWPANYLGEPATIDELMSESARLLEAHNNHLDPHLPMPREW